MNRWEANSKLVDSCTGVTLTQQDRNFCWPVIARQIRLWPLSCLRSGQCNLLTVINLTPFQVLNSNGQQYCFKYSLEIGFVLFIIKFVKMLETVILAKQLPKWFARVLMNRCRTMGTIKFYGFQLFWHIITSNCLPYENALTSTRILRPLYNFYVRMISLAVWSTAAFRIQSNCQHFASQFGCSYN